MGNVVLVKRPLIVMERGLWGTMEAVVIGYPVFLVIVVEEGLWGNQYIW